jgi:hypothetical protein
VQQYLAIFNNRWIPEEVPELQVKKNSLKIVSWTCYKVIYMLQTLCGREGNKCSLLDIFHENYGKFWQKNPPAFYTCQTQWVISLSKQDNTNVQMYKCTKSHRLQPILHESGAD